MKKIPAPKVNKWEVNVTIGNKKKTPLCGPKSALRKVVVHTSQPKNGRINNSEVRKFEKRVPLRDSAQLLKYHMHQFHCH